MSPQNIASYERVLAAIGHLIDREKWTQVCIMELEGGILVQGTSIVPTTQSYALTLNTQVLDYEALRQMVVPSAKD